MTANDEYVRRIDRPHPRLLAISLSNSVLLCGLGRDADGFAMAEARPRGDEATGLVTKLRHHLEGALFVGVLSVGRRFHRLDFTRENQPVSLLLDNDAQAARVVLVGESGRTLVSESTHESAREFELTDAAQPATFIDAGVLLERARRATFAEKRIALARRLRTHLAKVDRRLLAIANDARAARGASSLRAAATALLSFVDRATTGPASLRLLNPYGDGTTEIDVSIAENLTAPEQAEAYFRRARKLETAEKIATTRLATTQEERRQLAVLVEAVAAVDLDEQSLLGIAARAKALGLKDAERVAAYGEHVPTTRSVYRRFVGSGNVAMFVGKTAADNDHLTLKVAAPHDLWLHARGVAGAHVIVKRAKGAGTSAETLVDAAHLAAHFSEARDEAIVDVEYVERRHVRKPKGSPPGLVVTQRSKNLALRVDRPRLTRLLASEESP